MFVLTLETTCDETAAAVISDQLEVLGSAVATQDKLHERFGGVVPEMASRAHVERVLPVIDEALGRAKLRACDLGAIAVAHTPGLAGSLLVGLSAAKSLCVALDVPLVAVNHLHAHVYACRLASGRDVFPCVALVASGGHTSLFQAASPIDFELLGGTIDDAAGEAFDKVASMLGLSYPGGPAIQRAAAGGDARAYRFPRSFIHEPERLQFSFSGLKTAVRYMLERSAGDASSASRVADIAASFQQAVADVLVAKSVAALERTGFKTLCVGGGVAANACLREELDAAAARSRFELHIAPPELCTDNAVMGAIAIEHIRAGRFADLWLDVLPGVVREKGARSQ